MIEKKLKLTKKINNINIQNILQKSIKKFKTI